jgi:hypothetical protein
MGQVIVIPADDSVAVSRRAADTPPGLDELQKLTGGYIEAVPLWEAHNGKPCVVYCAEEGKLRGFKPNYRATKMWWNVLGRMVDDFLVGDVVIVVDLPDRDEE